MLKREQDTLSGQTIHSRYLCIKHYASEKCHENNGWVTYRGWNILHVLISFFIILIDIFYIIHPDVGDVTLIHRWFLFISPPPPFFSIKWFVFFTAPPTYPFTEMFWMSFRFSEVIFVVCFNVQTYFEFSLENDEILTGSFSVRNVEREKNEKRCEREWTESVVVVRVVCSRKNEWREEQYGVDTVMVDSFYMKKNCHRRLLVFFLPTNLETIIISLPKSSALWMGTELREKNAYVWGEIRTADPLSSGIRYLAGWVLLWYVLAYIQER